MKLFRTFLASVLAVLFSVGAFAQTKTASGTVSYASDGTPVVGAYVQVEGTQTGTITDVDGRFEMKNLPQSAKYLIVTNLGSKDSRVAVGTDLKIFLEDDSMVLEQAVVTGMQVIDRRLSTGSAAKVDASEANISGMTDVSRSLEGRVAGVSVQNVSGTFGTAPKIRVRGATSIYGSSKPLWVVDGVIMEDVVDVSADQLSSGDA
ncbi:MAG: carboxypeptidase-like regulatory domain-containing protein, partial [Bacteroidales bacterium]|nr:carboxypeptidase-like regulatory domain-containing protein [Bacteroidales bacterium]